MKKSISTIDKNFKLSKDIERLKLLEYQFNFEIFDAILTNEIIRLKNLKNLLDE